MVVGGVVFRLLLNTKKKKNCRPTVVVLPLWAPLLLGTDDPSRKTRKGWVNLQ